jgi:ABC-type phosphate/phosphonate transport system substrate-binding protein
VKSLVGGSIEIAWNSPLAWIDAQRRSGNGCRAIAMRDTDRDRCSHIVVRKGPAVSSIGDLSGRTIAFGALDSPQATLLPKEHLRRNGMPESSYRTRRFDVLVGKHGDHIGGEMEAFRALVAGEADASCMLDLNWNAWCADGTIDPEHYAVLSTTAPFDHCVFTVRRDFPEDRERRFLDALFSMDYEDPKQREMMDLEGLKRWEPGRTTGFELLTSAVEAHGIPAAR